VNLKHLDIAITGRCNRNCLHCAVAGRFREDLELQQFRDALREFQPVELHLTGGEPRLHPYFKDILAIAVEFCERVSVVTSGGVSLEELWTWKNLGIYEIAVSVDGSSVDHDKLRGEGSYKDTLSTLCGCMAIGLRSRINTVVHEQNLSSALRIIEVAEEWNVSRLAFIYLTEIGDARVHRLRSAKSTAWKSFLASLQELVSALQCEVTAQNPFDQDWNCFSQACTVVQDVPAAMDSRGVVHNCPLLCGVQKRDYERTLSAIRSYVISSKETICGSMELLGRKIGKTEGRGCPLVATRIK